ncbi:hypothetical protein [Nonomuraea sp. NPDC005650]|uniref:hypothetical protein n=1 Tax=Nonomuraea sp. NPDC005650 TaxID=3157045 RepID=UPI0033AD5B77
MIRHESLRTIFGDFSGSEGVTTAPSDRVRQQVLPGAKWSTVWVPGDWATAEELFADPRANIASRYDPLDPAPLKVVLVGTPQAVEAVLVAIPHMCADFVGFGDLREEFFTALSARMKGGTPRLKPVWQPRQQAAAEGAKGSRRAVEASAAYFAKVLREAPRAFVATDRPRSRMRASYATVVSPALAGHVHRLARQCQASVPAVLSTLVMLLLGAHAAERRVMMKSLCARRQRLRGTTFVAPQNLTTVMSLDLPGDCTVAELISLGWTASLRGYRHAEHDPRTVPPLEAELAGPWGEADGFCLFNYMAMNGEDTILGCPEPPGDGFLILDSKECTIPKNMRFIFECYLSGNEQTIEIALSADEALIHSSAARFAVRLAAVAEHAAADVSAPVSACLAAAGMSMAQ